MNDINTELIKEGGDSSELNKVKVNIPEINSNLTIKETFKLF